MDTSERVCAPVQSADVVASNRPHFRARTRALARTATTTTTAAGEPFTGLTFLVENMECRQAHVGNFILAERNFLTHCYVSRRRIRSGAGCCGHSARQRQ